MMQITGEAFDVTFHGVPEYFLAFLRPCGAQALRLRWSTAFIWCIDDIWTTSVCSLKIEESIGQRSSRKVEDIPPYAANRTPALERQPSMNRTELSQQTNYGWSSDHFLQLETTGTTAPGRFRLQCPY